MIQPLQCPAYLASRASFLERAGWFVPVFGWIVAAQLEQRRREPFVQDIAAQLTARPAIPAGVWGADPRTQAVAQVVCEMLQEENDWPNARFIPEDPLHLIWMNADFILVDLEERLGVKIPAYDTSIGIERPSGELERLDAMTLGEVVDYLIRRGARVGSND